MCPGNNTTASAKQSLHGREGPGRSDDNKKMLAAWKGMSKLIKDTHSLLKICKALLQVYQGHWGGDSSAHLKPRVVFFWCRKTASHELHLCFSSSCQMHVAISVCAADTEEVTVYLLGAASSLSVLIVTNTAMNTQLFAPCPCKQYS